MAQFPTLDNAAGVWKLQDVYNNVMDGTWPNNGAIGLFAGGLSGAPGYTAISTISKLIFSTGGQATVFGDLISPQKGLGGGTCSSLVRGIFSGGANWPAQVVENVIQYVTFSTEGNSSDFGDIITSAQTLGHLSNSIRGISAGGSTGPAYLNVIQFITMASTGNATDFGDLLTGSDGQGAVSNSTRGIFAGGRNPTNNVIQFITIASAGDATDFGDLTAARAGIQSASNSTRGLFAGGYVAPSRLNTIDYVTIASAGNAIDFGDLLVASAYSAGTSNSIKGLFGLRTAGGVISERIDSVVINSLGNSSDFADLATNQGALGNASNAHGGLSDGYQGTRPPVFFNVGDQGIAMGGSGSTAIDKFKISETGNTTNFGTLGLAGLYYATGASNETRGIAAGGENPALFNTIQYITFSSDGNTADFGDLTIARSNTGALSNSTRAVWSGGGNPASPTAAQQTMDYVEISSLGNAADFGDMTDNTI
jgi:hypothetical protein